MCHGCRRISETDAFRQKFKDVPTAGPGDFRDRFCQSATFGDACCRRGLGAIETADAPRVLPVAIQLPYSEDGLSED
jgi:hypothetical protein